MQSHSLNKLSLSPSSIPLSLSSFHFTLKSTMRMLHVVYVGFSACTACVCCRQPSLAPFFSLIGSVWVCSEQEEPWCQLCSSLEVWPGSGGLGGDWEWRVRGEPPHSWESPAASVAPAWLIESSWVLLHLSPAPLSLPSFPLTRQWVASSFPPPLVSPLLFPTYFLCNFSSTLCFRSYPPLFPAVFFFSSCMSHIKLFLHHSISHTCKYIQNPWSGVRIEACC